MKTIRSNAEELNTGTTKMHNIENVCKLQRFAHQNRKTVRPIYCIMEENALNIEKQLVIII